jgi:bifunctional DNase/RNase
MKDHSIAITRVFVQEKIADQYIAALKTTLEGVNKQFGANPSDPELLFGPPATKVHYY